MDAVPTPAERPQDRFRPDLLGTPYVLSISVPTYMPREISELLRWMLTYLSNAAKLAATFPTIFGPAAPYPPALLQSIWSIVNQTVDNLNAWGDYVRSLRIYRDIVLFAREQAAGSVLPPPLPTPPAVLGTSHVGIVHLIDAQVRLLRIQPNFNQTHAELLGIIPPAPGSVDLAQIIPALRVRNMGGNRVLLNWRSAGGIRGIMGAIVRVNRGDGRWIDLATNTPVGHFTDTAMQPVEPGVWTYAVFYMDESGGQIGQVSEVSITVSASAVVVRDANLNQHKP